MSFFVTGTDTSCGKTVAATALVRALKNRGYRVAGMKPIASGASGSPAGLRNDDALALLGESSTGLRYEHVNPYVFAPPVAPHIAAAAAGVVIEFAIIQRAFDACRRRADIVVVEGVGGWMVPLDERRYLADLVRALALPVVLVVGLRLGCINHALLTLRAVQADGLELIGWIANASIPDYVAAPATIETLRCRIAVPLLGLLPHQPTPDIEALALQLRGGLDHRFLSAVLQNHTGAER